MGSTDVPPPHLPSHVVPLSNLFLQVGGSLWTLCYALMAWESFKAQSYGMPLFALALNVAWEMVYGLLVSPPWSVEQLVFISWLVLDLVMVLGMIKFARHEWDHSPGVARRIVAIFVVMTSAATVGHWAFASWWIENEIGKRPGKYFRGVVGPDVTELGYWSAMICQVHVSISSLCQLVVRQHSGGVSWSIWVTRMLGSIIGFYMVFGWEWYFWSEAHEYFVSPFGIFLLMTALICDTVYPFVLWEIKKTETVLGDGRKVAATSREAKISGTQG